MIILESDGWWFVTDLRRFGPYADLSGATRCRENYAAYVSNAPDCHHDLIRTEEKVQ